MKITVVGGGSTYTPELVEGFADRQRALGLTELHLHDVDADRLAVVAGLARRIMASRGIDGLVTTSTDLEAAVAGASAVLVQLRVGGQRTRLLDETVPLRFGLIGQETTAAGGFFKALRTVPVVLDIAETVRRVAGQNCWIIDFTNPVGINTRALLDAGHRAIGLCNVGISTQRWLAELLGLDADRVRLDHVGLNHLTWVRAVEVDGTDVLPDLFDRPGFAEWAQRRCGLPIDALRTLGALPSYYLSYYYATDLALAKQQGGEHRAEEVLAIERELLELYRDPHLDRAPELLTRRGGAFYSTAAAALATSLLTGDGAHHYVNIRNGSAVPGLPPEAVVEVAAHAGLEGALPSTLRPVAPELLGLMQAVTSYETLAIEAATTGDPRTARRALIAHPLVRQWAQVDGVFEALLEAHAAHLPAFAAAA